MTNNNPAKFAFFYLLSLISLISLAMATGSIIFQIINKYVVDVLNELRGTYSSSSLRFSISSIIISAPIFYYVSHLINKSLHSGELEKDSQIRKWLSYLILLISFIVMSGWFVGIIFNFLDGELTLKFILKAITAVAIAGTVFSYYFYDLKRKEVLGKKDRVVLIYSSVTALVVLVTLVSAFIFVESPKDARLRKIDNETLLRLSNVDNSISEYYRLNNQIPAELRELLNESNTLVKEKNLYSPGSNEFFAYSVIEDTKYRICANFYLSNKDTDDDYRYSYLKQEWLHDAGEQCFERRVDDISALMKEELIR